MSDTRDPTNEYVLDIMSYLTLEDKLFFRKVSKEFQKIDRNLKIKLRIKIKFIDRHKCLNIGNGIEFDISYHFKT